MKNKKGFTILELLVVVAIIAILSAIAIPNFIGRIEEAKDSRELAEINAVEKAIATYYVDNGVYPTLQGKDGTLLQPQPVKGSPHNIDFSPLVPDYLASLPSFSYWWVDYQGDVTHTEGVYGRLNNGVFTPNSSYTYDYYKSDGSVVPLTGPVTLGVPEYVVPKDSAGVEHPSIGASFKNPKAHPEAPEYVGLVTGVTLNKTTSVLQVGNTETLVATVAPSNAVNKKVTWQSSNPTVASVDTTGKVTFLSAGSASITVTTEDGNYTSSCFVTDFTSKTFTNTGVLQTFTINTAGVYKLEAWGSVGGTGGTYKSNFEAPTTQGLLGAYGNYAYGNIRLNAGDVLYVYAGSKGASGAHYTSSTGSTWASYGMSGGGGGGGATEVRLNVDASANAILKASGGKGGNGQGEFNGTQRVAAGSGGWSVSGSAGVAGNRETGGAGGGSTSTYTLTSAGTANANNNATGKFVLTFVGD